MGRYNTIEAFIEQVDYEWLWAVNKLHLKKYKSFNLIKKFSYWVILSGGTKASHLVTFTDFDPYNPFWEFSRCLRTFVLMIFLKFCTHPSFGNLYTNQVQQGEETTLKEQYYYCGFSLSVVEPWKSIICLKWNKTRSRPIV